MQAWQECSKKLVTLGELDPTYNLVAHARDQIGMEWARRFCLAHLMFYDVGTSITLADVDEKHFWFRVMKEYPDLKRGQERRHFRGVNGLQSIDSMRHTPPGQVFESVIGGKPVSLRAIFSKVQEQYKGFGAYFILKWTDFIDVLYQASVDYSALVQSPNQFLFDGAAKGLESIWPGQEYSKSLMQITDYIREWYDPFQGYRKCGISEAETCACAYRTYYVKTTYKFGWDINNLRTTLEKHLSPSAKTLLEGVPQPIEEFHASNAS